MPKLLSGYIAKQVGKYLGKHVLPATLTKVSPGSRTAGSTTAGTNPTSADYACRGFVSDYDASEINGTTVQDNDRKVTLLGATIASGQVPKTSDKVTISDKAGAPMVTYRIRRVQSDPDGATYTLTCER